MRLGGFALLAVLGVPAVNAQADPYAPVFKLVDQVARDMHEVDQLLFEASRPPTVEGQLADARVTQRDVVRGIDELLLEIDKIQCTCPGGT